MISFQTLQYVNIMKVSKWGSPTCAPCIRADEVIPRVLEEFDIPYFSYQIRKDPLVYERYRGGVPLIYFEVENKVYPYRGYIADTPFKLWIQSVLDGCVDQYYNLILEE